MEIKLRIPCSESAYNSMYTKLHKMYIIISSSVLFTQLKACDIPGQRVLNDL
jgi:hypothetical protein